MFGLLQVDSVASGPPTPQHQWIGASEIRFHDSGAESLGPFESTMSDNKQYLVERRVPTKETALKLLVAHQDPGQCPAVYSGRWRADPDLPCTIEMKHVGLALARTSDQTQATAGQRVSGAPLELAVRSHSLNVIEVLLRAGAVVEGKGRSSWARPIVWGQGTVTEIPGGASPPQSSPKFPEEGSAPADFSNVS